MEARAPARGEGRTQRVLVVIRAHPVDERLRSADAEEGGVGQEERIEDSRARRGDVAVAESAKGFAARLQGIEQALAQQRAQELEVMRSSNKVMLIIAGLFAVLGFLAMLFMAYFQWRTINRLAEISATLPLAHSFASGSSLAALGTTEARLLASPEAPIVLLRRRPGKEGASAGVAPGCTGTLDPATKNVVSVFQMKYRPARYDGVPDPETAALLEVLTAKAK